MKLQNPSRSLPPPSDEERKQVQPLLNLICDEIGKRDNKLDFASFMDMALYTPDLGYYASNKAIFGEQGDFVTAPELSPVFSRCVARQVQDVLEKLEGGGDVLEFGAGAGTMACDVLMELDLLNSLPNHYYISELSENLRQRQKSRISTYAPHLLNLVTWIDEVPKNFRGIMLGNEILDAIPTRRVRLNHDGNHEELFVSYEKQSFNWKADKPDSEELRDEMNRIYKKVGNKLPDHYETEVNLASFHWLENIATALQEGVIILIDYGFSEEEFYRPERHEGSLMCHYKHCAHSNPLTHVGMQDITSHVNFTAIAEVAFAQELTIAGYTNQTYFLLACGLEHLLGDIDINDTKQFIIETQPVKVLILPDEMGELFKVLGLSKNFDHDLLGFGVKDLLERL